MKALIKWNFNPLMSMIPRYRSHHQHMDIDMSRRYMAPYLLRSKMSIQIHIYYPKKSKIPIQIHMYYPFLLLEGFFIQHIFLFFFFYFCSLEQSWISCDHQSNFLLRHLFSWGSKKLTKKGIHVQYHYARPEILALMAYRVIFSYRNPTRLLCGIFSGRLWFRGV